MEANERLRAAKQEARKVHALWQELTARLGYDYTANPRSNDAQNRTSNTNTRDSQTPRSDNFI